MAEYALSQKDADDLMKAEKHRVDDKCWRFPVAGAKIAVPLESSDRRERFLMDVSRGSIRLSKVTYQTRARKTHTLWRLDVEGPPHTNPDGTVIRGPHLHVYREGFGDRWAEPAPESFDTLDDMIHTLDQFMDLCSVVGKPLFQGAIW